MSYALAFVKLITVSVSVSSYVCIVQRFEPSIIIIICDDNSPIHHACPLAKIISIPLSLSTFFSLYSWLYFISGCLGQMKRTFHVHFQLFWWWFTWELLKAELKKFRCFIMHVRRDDNHVPRDTRKYCEAKPNRIWWYNNNNPQRRERSKTTWFRER